MTNHTPGKLDFRESPIRDVAAIFNGINRRMFDVVGIPDARRLVAAWNFCDGVTTELIENAKPLGRLVGEHEELAVALSNLVGEIRAYQSPECDDPDAPGSAELKAAEAILAKVGKPS